MDEYGGGFRTVANELRVRFPGVPGAFGTADLLIANKKFVILVDWKFGQGVPVKAVYNDEQAIASIRNCCSTSPARWRKCRRCSARNALPSRSFSRVPRRS